MFKVEKALELYADESTIAAAARRYCEEEGMEYTDTVRRALSKLVKKHTNSVESLTETNQYANDIERPLTLSAFDKDGRLMNIDEYCQTYGLDKESIRSFKLITHTGVPYYNIVFQEESSEKVMDLEFIEEIVKKYIKPLPTVDSDDLKYYLDMPRVDRLIISDVHIGMDNYGGKNIEPIFNNPRYTTAEIIKRYNIMIGKVKSHKTSGHLIIDNLGDFVDGMGGQTTRGGHTLPQLMSDKEVFELGVELTINMVEELLKEYQSITLNNVINDNHGFMMGYFIHSTCKRILETKHPGRVDYTLHEKFLSYYKAGMHTFILCHGKDSQDMKHGMKLYADDKIVNKIDNYCKEYGLYDGNYIEFSKGDLHKYVVDCNANDFDYVNYPSFAPPSNWVQTNFGNSKSGFVMQSISMKSFEKSTTVIWF